MKNLLLTLMCLSIFFGACSKEDIVSDPTTKSYYSEFTWDDGSVVKVIDIGSYHYLTSDLFEIIDSEASGVEVENVPSYIWAYYESGGFSVEVELNKTPYDRVANIVLRQRYSGKTITLIVKQLGMTPSSKFSFNWVKTGTVLNDLYVPSCGIQEYTTDVYSFDNLLNINAQYWMESKPEWVRASVWASLSRGAFLKVDIDRNITGKTRSGEIVLYQILTNKKIRMTVIQNC